MNFLQTSLIGTLSFIAVGCGGGGSSGSSSSPTYSCFGSGSSYLCTPMGSGTATTPAPTASPFPILTSFATVINSGISASGLETKPYTPGTFTANKSPATATTFNSAPVLAQVSSTNWTTGGYPTPYTQYYDSSYNLVGFVLAGLYGKRTSGTVMPAIADNGASGTLSQFTLYSDSGLTTQAGTATLTYNINNCCDLYDKKKADLKLTLTLIQLSGAVMGSLTQKYVVTTTGGVSFGYEKFNDGTNDRELFYAYGGY